MVPATASRQSPAIQDLHSYSRQGQFLHSRIELNIPFYQQDKNKVFKQSIIFGLSVATLENMLERKMYDFHTQSRKMELYLKAGADGLTVGDCPFAHYVRSTEI